MEILQQIQVVEDPQSQTSTAIVPFTKVPADSWDSLLEESPDQQPPLKYRKVAWFDKGSKAKVLHPGN